MAAHVRTTTPSLMPRDPNPGSPSRSRHRGNSLILVTAILVLLVIVAAAFLSRTQAGRQTSSAQQQAIQREERVEPIANMVTDLLTNALFPQPMDPSAVANGNVGVGHRVNPLDTGMRTVTSAWPRLATQPNAQLFGIDRDNNGDMSPDFGYNVAPYETRPWTNWPDFLHPNFPLGAGQLDGAVLGAGNIPIGDGNPLGNPGTADGRIYRSTEPVRLDANNDGQPDGFSHWEHLTWLATANNGFRLCTDISHIVNNTLDSSNESDFTRPFALGMPYEQWLPNFVPTGVSNANDFRNRANNWFGAPNNGNSYIFTYASSNALPNLFRLRDLPADLRAEVSKTFADTDGDGFTDAFWFLAPTSVDRSLRYLVAASVVDLSGLVNFNVGTRFNPWNTTGATPSDLALVGNSGTPGESVGFLDNPANTFDGAGAINSLYTAQDIANEIYAPALVTYKPEFYGEDDAAIGPTFLKAIGMKDGAGNRNPALLDLDFQANAQAEFYSAFERLQYWKSGPLAAGAPEFGLAPFGISDELELRSYNGQNNPWVTTRLETAVNGQDRFYQFFRSTPLRGETNEAVAQLTNRELLLDNRRKATTVNGARNDIAPAWLWPSPFADPRLDYNRDRFASDSNGDLIIDNAAVAQADLDAYARQQKKIDLRQAFTDPPLSADPATAASQIFARRFNWRNDVQQLLERSLTRVWVDATNPTAPALLYQSYLGRSANANSVDQYNQFRKTLHMAASMTANIDQWRDGPDPTVTIPFDAPLHPWVGTSAPDWLEPTTAIRYIGQERQPFLMEAFFALVYPKSKVGLGNNIVADLAAKGYVVNNDWEIPIPFKSAGENYVDSSSKPGIVIAVQVGNPTELPLSLAGFALRIDGRNYTFPPNTILPPTTRERPSTATVFAIKASNVDTGGVGEPGYFTPAAWINFLDISATDLASGSLVFDGSGPLVNGVSMLSPVEYEQPDGPGIETAPFFDLDVELLRLIPWPAGIGNPPVANGTASVVIDRFDRPGDSNWNFRAAVNRLLEDDTRRPPKQKYNIDDPDIDRWSMNGVRLKNDDYLVAYARVARPWTWDVPERTPEVGSNVAQGASDGIIRPDELNPRFVFAFKADARPKDAGDLPDLKMQDDSPQEVTFQGDTYSFDDQPDGDGVDPASLWITYDYADIYGTKERDGITDRPLRRGKPTFFPCITRRLGQNNVYPTGQPFPTLAELQPNVPPASLAINASFPKGSFDPFTVGDKGLKATDWERIYKPAAGNVGTTYHDALMASFQMNIKDDDFEQIGELLNVFCWGPVLDCTTSFFTPETVRTFSEVMLLEQDIFDQPVGRGTFVNRLRITPFRDAAVAAHNLSGWSPTDGPTALLAPPLVGSGSSAASAFFTGLLPTQGLPSPNGQQQSYNREISKLVGRVNMPSLPAGSSLFDGVVCDDRGWRFAAAERDQEAFRLRNAAGYSGSLTPGMVNVNDALTETMRALPHMTVLVNNDSPVHFVDEYGNATTANIPSVNNPITRVVESIQRYRDKTITQYTSGTIWPPAVGDVNVPYYFDRGFDLVPSGINTFLMAPFVWNSLTFSGLRSDRGIVSIGELLLTQRTAGIGSSAAWNINNSFSIEFAGLDPYKLGGVGAPPLGAYDRLTTPRLATDRTNGRGSAFPAPAVVTTTDNPLPRVSFVPVVPDRVGGDAEERNLLFAGLSNMVSVRSDVFAVYLRIKSVRQDPVNGRWDATDPSLLADDSRYVMIVDRSNVKQPGDRPRILSFQKVESPN
ncbi:MAG: hypothetical protein JNL80_07035 [Phycisphaerae bacterium]|jgi:hypothetical protein|nr:hypothetical protein [Phycisphaerae bacterium]